LQVGSDRLPFRRAEGALTTTLQMGDDTSQYKTVRPFEHPTRIAEREVASPARQIPTEITQQVSDRHVSPAAGGQFPHTVAKAAQRAFRGKHIQIPPAAAKQVAVKAERVSQTGGVGASGVRLVRREQDLLH
jgi:hypothetical protein